MSDRITVKHIFVALKYLADNSFAFMAYCFKKKPPKLDAEEEFYYNNRALEERHYQDIERYNKIEKEYDELNELFALMMCFVARMYPGETTRAALEDIHALMKTELRTSNKKIHREFFKLFITINVLRKKFKQR